MPKKITDPAKIVTDPVMLSALAKQGIDSEYVEFYQDYAPRSLGKGHSPYAKFYRDLKSGKKFMVVSGLPMVKPDGIKIEVGWKRKDNEYISKPNLFEAVIKDKEIKLSYLDKKVIWRPQLFLDNVEQTCGEVALLETDPTNENYHQNVLEWDYGICLRRLRIIEGAILERWLTSYKGIVAIAHNFEGNLPIRIGSCRRADNRPVVVQVIGDREIIDTTDFPDSAFPIEIGASLTVYSTSSDGAAVRNDLVSGGYAATHDAGDADSVRDNIVADLVSNRRYFDPEYYEISRLFLYFDTSALGGNVVVSEGTLSLRRDSDTVEADGGHSDVCLVEGVQNEPLVVGDYGTHKNKTIEGTDARWEYPLAAGAYTDKTLNATGYGWINKTGTTLFCVRCYGDLNNNPPAGDNRVLICLNEKGAGYLPKLVVTYGTLYEMSCSDGLVFGDTPSTQAILNALAADGISLGDTSLAQVIFNVLVTDGIILGDSPAMVTVKLHKVLKAFTGRNLSDPATFKELQDFIGRELK